MAPGQPFEAHFVDLNNDGKLEIIASAFDTRYTVKKGLATFPSPAGISPTKLSLAGNGNVANLFFMVYRYSDRLPSNHSLLFLLVVGTCG